MRAALHVFRKESRELFRDRRVINGAFIMPVFIIALMMMLFGFISSAVGRDKPVKVVVVESPVAKSHMSQLFPKTEIKWVASRAAGEKLMEAGKAQVVLEFAPDFEAKLQQGGAKISALYEKDETLSEITLGKLTGMLAGTNRVILAQDLKAAGLPETKAESVVLVPEDYKKPGEEEQGSAMLVQLLPYLIVIWAFYGGFSTVSDMIAGEKERGTMETLLISPAHRTEIVLGKYLALSLICFISSLMSVVGLVLVRLIHLPGTAEIMKEVSVSPAQFLAVTAVLIPLVLFFAGLLMAVSAPCKNMREAQTYLTLTSFVVIMPAMFVQFIGFTELAKEMWLKFVPILNSAVAIREALKSGGDWASIGIAGALNLALATLMFSMVVRLFQREQILTRV